MKKYTFDFIILSVLWTIIYYGLNLLFKKFGIQGDALLFGLICILFYTSFSYKKWWSMDTFKSKKSTLIFIFSTTLLFVFFTYGMSVYNRTADIYTYLNTKNKRGWHGQAHQADDTLGLAPMPNARAFHTFPIGDDIAMAFDNQGFRIPLADTNKTNSAYKNLDLLFLGCSFTYGDACLAEETFPFLVAKNTKLSYANAGVCSYGLAHILILAERLIPKYRPKYVVVQYSPWLIDRAVAQFAPVYYGSLPNPYFVENKDKIELHLPLYKTQMFNLEMEDAKNKSLLSFFTQNSLPFFLKEDWTKLKSKTKILIDFNKKPVANPEKAELYAYSRIIEIAKTYHTKVIILNLYNDNKPMRLEKLIAPPDVLFANADALLYGNLTTNNYAHFEKAYAHWRMKGTDSVKVDGHPNPLAHKIIAQSIIDLIN